MLTREGDMVGAMYNGQVFATYPILFLLFFTPSHQCTKCQCCVQVVFNDIFYRLLIVLVGIGIRTGGKGALRNIKIYP